MKTTRKCSRQQIVNRNIIISILLAAVLGIFNSARAQDADEAEMEIEDWMIDPAYWQNVSKEIEKKYYSLVVREDNEPELELEPWMLNFHNEILYDNYYVAEEEQEVEDWMLDLNQFQPVIRMVANN
jgi:hypothetical protein